MVRNGVLYSEFLYALNICDDVGSEKNMTKKNRLCVM